MTQQEIDVLRKRVWMATTPLAHVGMPNGEFIRIFQLIMDQVAKKLWDKNV
jgi:hypothetical protein